MDGAIVQTYLSDVLHVVAQSLLAPDIVLLLALIAYALFCIGSVIAEHFSERRHFKVAMPKFLAELMAADEAEMPEVIARSGLLNRQKIALLTVYDYRFLPGDALVALIRRLVNEEETRHDRITGRNNMAARIAPMLGLMGTLIPLGPGIQALGSADTATLSSSLLVAFDTTVAGLVAAAVCLVVGKIRMNWYGNYMSALDSAMATMLQKIEQMREDGQIVTQEPSDYAFLYEKKSGKKSGKGKKSAAKAGRAAAGAAAADAGIPVTDGYGNFGDAGFAAAPGAQAAPALQDMPSMGAPEPQFAYEPAAQTGPIFQAPETQPQPYAPAVAEPQPFGQQPTGEIPAFNPLFAGQVAPPIQEVPMPAFLDTLAATAQPAGLDQRATAPSAIDPQQTAPIGSGWYQPQAQPFAGIEEPVPTWNFGQVAGDGQPYGQPAE